MSDFYGRPRERERERARDYGPITRLARRKMIIQMSQQTNQENRIGSKTKNKNKKTKQIKNEIELFIGV